VLGSDLVGILRVGKAVFTPLGRLNGVEGAITDTGALTGTGDLEPHSLGGVPPHLSSSQSS
jgi:hypothetical protein